MPDVSLFQSLANFLAVIQSLYLIILALLLSDAIISCFGTCLEQSLRGAQNSVRLPNRAPKTPQEPPRAGAAEAPGQRRRSDGRIGVKQRPKNRFGGRRPGY